VKARVREKQNGMKFQRLHCCAPIQVFHEKMA